MGKEIVPTYIGWYQPHHPVNWDGLVPDPKTGELVKEPSMTKQSHREECDVNNIVKQYILTGNMELLNVARAAGVYADLPDNFDYQQAMNVVVQGTQAFDSLPSAIRERFANNPEKFLEFMADPANQDEIIKMGLATDNRPPEDPPAPPPPSDPPTPA